MTADLIPWPIPGDSELDKARRIAMDYRNELHRIAPEHCEELDAQARRLGQGWVTPQIQHLAMDDWITIREAADYTGLSTAAIRKWITRPPRKLAAVTGNDRLMRVRVGELVDVQAEQRKRRVQRHAQRAS